jgi:hypothetical protein
MVLQVQFQCTHDLEEVYEEGDTYDEEDTN